MGLYSTNNVKAVQEQEIDQFNESVFADIDKYVADKSFCNIMEAVVQLHENDQKMFDALIECDFISATNEAVMLEADAEEANAAGNEVKANKIADTIHKIFESIIAAIKKAAANIIYKITDLLKSDKKLYDAYKDKLKIENLKDFPGIADFALPKALVNSDTVTSIENAKKFTEELNSRLAGLDDKEAINGVYEEFNAKVEKRYEAMKKMSEDETYFGTKEKLWKPTESWQITKMLNVLSGGSAVIKEIKEQAAKVISELKQIQASAKSALSSVKKQKNEVATYKANVIYKASSTTCKMFSKEFSAVARVATMQVAACRKAAILCGRYALKQAKGEKPAEAPVAELPEKTNESMIMWALGESSDAYVFEKMA